MPQFPNKRISSCIATQNVTTSEDREKRFGSGVFYRARDYLAVIDAEL